MCLGTLTRAFLVSYGQLLYFEYVSVESTADSIECIPTRSGVSQRAHSGFVGEVTSVARLESCTYRELTLFVKDVGLLKRVATRIVLDADWMLRKRAMT